MPIKTVLVLGSAPDCDLVLQGPGVAPKHAQLMWRDGLVLHNLGTGQTLVDNQPMGPGENRPLQGFHARVQLGGAFVPLNAPELASLFIDRSPLPAQGDVYILGRDPARAHLIVQHPAVSGAHARVDFHQRSITDLGSSSGTFDRNSQRLPPNQAVPLDEAGGYFFGPVWLATSAFVQLGRRPPSMAGAPGGMQVNTAAQASPPLPQGRPLSQPPPGPTAAAAPAAPAAPQRPRTVFGQIDLGALGQLGKPKEVTIGRLPPCEIVLPFPQLSGRHAVITRSAEGKLSVRDLGSTNGTYVRGQRLPPNVPAELTPGERIFVGPYPLIVNTEGDTIQAYIDQENSQWSGNLVEIEAINLQLQVPDREQKNRDKILLENVTFKARPGDLIALMGPSGAGKTTLLTVLNGYLRPSSGEVRVNGENLYAIYDALRGSIGYVPQDDIVHPELTVFEAVKYSAQFRLPADYSEEEINRRVEQTLKDLGLEQVKNLEIGKPERKVLSGGQRKRVNIAMELVTDPALMFLDEPTSGLAADDTVALIDLLRNLATKSGKTIIVTIHQPAREEYEKFNLAFIMGFGGQPVYFGPTGKESYEFFGRYAAQRGEHIDNPRDMFDQLKIREEELAKSAQFPSKAEARLAAAKLWRNEYYQDSNPTYRKMYSGARQPGTPGSTRPPSRIAVPLIRQFKLLLQRYAIVKKRDRTGTAILLLQAPIIGVLLALVFNDPAKLPNLWCRLTLERMQLEVLRARTQQIDGICALSPERWPSVADMSGALFFLVIAAIWFGTSNAAREIVAEQAIYRRERMVNLSIPNYVLSKFVLLSVLCIVQCTALLLIVYPLTGLGNGDFGGFFPMLIMLILTAMSSVALGLLLSSVVVSSEAAMALTPIALIPQVVLGGRMVPMTSKVWLPYVMALIPARWSLEGVMGVERRYLEEAWKIKACGLQGVGINQDLFNCALEELSNSEHGMGGLGFTTYAQPWIASTMLVLTTVVLIGAVARLLKRRDSI